MAIQIVVGEGDAELGQLQPVDGAALGPAQLGILGRGAGAPARQQDLRQVAQLVVGGDARPEIEIGAALDLPGAGMLAQHRGAR